MPEITDVEQVKKIMKEKPIVIFFYMEGCPHCEETKPTWNKLTHSQLPYQFYEVESSVVPPETGITGFPHFLVNHKDGSSTSADGRKENVEELKSALKLVKKKRGGLRRLTKHSTSRRRSRKFTRRVRKRL